MFSPQETRRPSLLQQASGIIQEQSNREQLVSQAIQMVPALKMRLATLITSRIPCPEIIESTIRNIIDYLNFNALCYQQYTPGRFCSSSTESYSTRLVLAVPVENIQTRVTFLSSSYPLKDPEMVQTLTFSVGVDALDHVLKITDNGPFLASKNLFSDQRELKIRPALPDDIAGYQQLVDELLTRQDLTIIDASTSRKVVVPNFVDGWSARR